MVGAGEARQFYPMHGGVGHFVPMPRGSYKHLYIT